MNEDKKKRLTCTICGEIKDTYSALVFSQGDLVCKECKKITLEDDKRAYDRDVTLLRD